MSSLTHRPTIDAIIAKNGNFGPNDRVVEILEYRNIFTGGITWKLIYARDDAEYIRNNLACLSQKTIWRRK